MKTKLILLTAFVTVALNLANASGLGPDDKKIVQVTALSNRLYVLCEDGTFYESNTIEDPGFGFAHRDIHWTKLNGPKTSD